MNSTTVQKKEKFQPCKHMEATSALKNLVKMVMIILFAWYFKKAFTFLKDSSNDLPTMISTCLLLWSLFTYVHTYKHMHMHTHTHTTHSSTVILSGTLPPWQDWKFNVSILQEITVDGHFIFSVCHMAHILPITQPASQAYGPSYQDQQ